MNPFARWLIAIVIIWAIPAFFTWYGLAQYELLTRERLLEAMYENQKQVLEERSTLLDSDLFLHAAAQNLRTRLRLLGLSSHDQHQRQTAVVQDWANSFPAGFLEWYLFNASGTIWLASGTIPSESRQTVIHSLRQTGASLYLTAVPETVRTSWEHAGYALPRLWNRADIPVLLHQLKGHGQGTHWGYWWEPSSPMDYGGFLIARENAMTREQRISWLSAHDEPGTFSGFFTHTTSVQGNMPGAMDEFSACLFRQIELGHERALHGAYVTTCLWATRDHALWIAQPQPVAGVPWRVFLAGYGLLSVLFLSRSYEMLVLDGHRPVRLSWKLAGLFTLILGFPLAGVYLLGHFLVEEKRNELVQDCRRESLDRLRQLDQGYAQFVACECLRYRARIRRLEAFRHEPEALKKQVRAWFGSGGFDNHYMVSSASVFLAFEFNTSRALRRRLARIPQSEKERVFLGWITAGLIPGEADLRRFRGEPEPDCYPNQKEDLIKQATARMTLSALKQHDSDAGLEADKPDDGAVNALDVMIGDSNFDMVRVLRQKTTGFFFAGTLLDGNYYLFDIIRGPEGHAWYGILLGAEVGTIEGPYLEALSAHLNRARTATTFRFISTHDPYSPYYPDYAHAPMYQKLTERLRRGRRNVLFQRMELEGEPIEVVGMIGAKLMKYALYATTPVSAIEHRVLRFRRQVFLQLAVAAVLGSLLAMMIVRLLLVPVRELERGLEIIRTKRYESSIPVYSNDELGQLCHAFNRAILHLSDMEVASTVQKRLLPQESLRVGSFEWRGTNLMTQAVGGDYYDAISISSRQVAFALGDVSGHGVSAALVTAMAKAGFSILCPLFADDPKRVLELINHAFVDILQRKKMMTMFLAILDIDTGVVTFANAGQCSPILAGADGTCRYLRADSRPLGITKRFGYENRTITDFPAAILLYSDGIVEAQTREGEMVGYERFLSLTEESLQKQIPDPLDSIRERVATFLSDKGFDDDVTLLLLRRQSS
ncbi:MAG TPA: PP2C family protein-serine/threonine phosphatase [Candidatus Ozemobacteraceae bacterium]|nr:PP2C family protein-serine/threonine phosphatase [Candidatus Ozemobacteraceae bacterium]